MKIENSKSFKFLIGLIALTFHVSVFAVSDVSEKLQSRFENEITKINQALRKNQKAFDSSPELLVDFVDNSLLPLWSSTRTLKGLFGNKTWKSLSIRERQALIGSFNDTLQRYVQEGFKHYDGQQFEFVSVKLNKKQNRGYLTIKFIPDILPSFNVDFKIGLIEGDWRLYDVLVEGVSYISLKKTEYQKLHKEQGVERVLASIRKKNKGFMPSRLKTGEAYHAFSVEAKQ